MIPLTVTELSVELDGARIVESVDLIVPGGRWTTLIGPNGAGKTTVLRAVAGVVPFEGRVALGDAEAGRLRRRHYARLVAYVPQIPFLPRAMTVVDYVLMGRTPYIPYFGVETTADLAVVGNVLERLELVDVTERVLGSLSGGELQRVVLARSLAQQAPVLVLDEPTSALDVGHQLQVLELVDELRREHELTVLSAMHDLTLAGQFSDSLVLMQSGRVAATGSAEEVLTEEAIRTHYGASVDVIRNGRGVIVVPRRSGSGIGRAP